MIYTFAQLRDDKSLIPDEPHIYRITDGNRTLKVGTSKNSSRMRDYLAANDASGSIRNPFLIEHLES